MEIRKWLKILQRLVIFLAFLLVLVNLGERNYYLALLWGLIMLKDWSTLQMVDIIERQDKQLDAFAGITENYRMLVSPAVEAMKKSLEVADGQTN